MNEGLGGGYGYLMLFIVLGFLATVLGVLGAAAFRLMLRDDIYAPKED